MVDREANTKNSTDRGNVCSVYYNRLKRNMALGVDATLLYALGRLTPEPTAAELSLNSPYNSRTHTGLPPGPISNPGKAALMACITSVMPTWDARERIEFGDGLGAFVIDDVPDALRGQKERPSGNPDRRRDAGGQASG